MKPLSDNWEIFRALADSYTTIQDVRIGAENRIRNIKSKSDEKEEKRLKLLKKLAELKKEEKNYTEFACEFLYEEPVYAKFLSNVKGIGETISMKILSFPLDLERNISDWWAYAGLTPNVWKCTCENGHNILLSRNPALFPSRCYMTYKEKCNAVVLHGEIAPTRRYRGYASFWNPELKTLGYIITDCFIKTGVYYRKVFERYRTIGLNKGFTPLHANQYARRLTYKLFLYHLYQCGCELKGIQHRNPYVFDFLEHKWFIPWQEVVGFDSAIVRKRKKAIA